jgi:hypothetical protein
LSGYMGREKRVLTRSFFTAAIVRQGSSRLRASGVDVIDPIQGTDFFNSRLG